MVERNAQRAVFVPFAGPSQSIWNLMVAGVFPLTKRRTDDGTLLVALVAWDPDPDSGADLVVWRSALASRRFETGHPVSAAALASAHAFRARLVRLPRHNLRLNNTRQSR